MRPCHASACCAPPPPPPPPHHTHVQTARALHPLSAPFKTHYPHLPTHISPTPHIMCSWGDISSFPPPPNLRIHPPPPPSSLIDTENLKAALPSPPPTPTAHSHPSSHTRSSSTIYQLCYPLPPIALTSSSFFGLFCPSSCRPYSTPHAALAGKRITDHGGASSSLPPRPVFLSSPASRSPDVLTLAEIHADALEVSSTSCSCCCCCSSSSSTPPPTPHPPHAGCPFSLCLHHAVPLPASPPHPPPPAPVPPHWHQQRRSR